MSSTIAIKEFEMDEGPSEEEGEEESRVAQSAKRKVSRRMLPMIALTGFLLMIDSSCMAFVAPLLIEDESLDVSTSSYGLTVGLFYLSMTASQMPSSMIAHKYGLRIYLSVVLFLHGALVLGSAAAVRSLALLIVFRCALGAVVGSTISSMMAHVGLFFPSSEVAWNWARSQNIGTPAGMMVGGPLSAIILNFMHGSASAWRGVFVVEGVLFLLAVPLIFCIMPEAPDQCERFLTPRESAWLKRQAEEVQVERRRRSAKIAGAVGEQKVFVELLRDARILLLSLTAFVRKIAVYGQMFYTPLILEAGGLDVTTISWLLVIFLGAAIAFGLYWAHRSDVTKERVFHAATGILLMAVGCSGTALAIQTGAALWIQVILLTLARMGIYSFLIPFSAFQIDIMPKNASSIGFAFVAMCGNAAGFFGPLLIGLIQQRFGIPAGLFFMAGTSCFGLICLLPLSCLSSKEASQTGAEVYELVAGDPAEANEDEDGPSSPLLA